MKALRCSVSPRLVFALALLALTGCATNRYRAVQSRFEQAVRADNEQVNQPFTDPSVPYAAIAAELNPAYIAVLDGKLRPNAWTLRAVSEWRAGKLDSAFVSAGKGLATIEQLTKKDPKFSASRDLVILLMIPGLIEDSRLRQRLKDFGPEDIAANYDAIYSRKFHNAANALVEAKEKMSPATPTSVKYYWNYQCWRVLQNWRFVIDKLPPQPRVQARNEADKFIADGDANARGLGASGLLNAVMLKTAAANAEAGIPADHAYRKLIELESNH